MNIKNCFNAQGNFIPKLYYAERFGVNPNVYEISLKSEENINVDKLSKLTSDLFGREAEINTTVYENTNTTSSVISKYDHEDDDEDLYKNGEFITTKLRVIDTKDYYWEFTRDSISVYSYDNIENIKQAIKEIREKLPKQESKPKAAEIGLIAFDNGYYTINSKIEKIDINIEENYNDDFLPIFEDTKNFLNSRASGLIIYNGTRGTGKTSLIRFLCSQFPKKYRIVTNAIASRLAEPDFMSYLLENKNSVFILEDCEQILMDRSENTFGGAISNILNMSDGLMSDIFNIKFICTFNMDISKIDSALLRKGRCYANYEFKPLDKDKVKHLSEKYNLGITEYKDMTLAEIYNYESADYDTSNKPRKKMGF